MKKKLISLLLVSAMAAATAGCGSSVPANSVNSRDDLPGKKIGVQLGTTGDSDTHRVLIIIIKAIQEV